MEDQSLTSDRETESLEQLLSEIQQTPKEYWSNLLQLIRVFRESVTLKSAEDSFSQGWQEAMMGDTLPVSQLWEDIDAE